jgi:hypothetical protein
LLGFLVVILLEGADRRGAELAQREFAAMRVRADPIGRVYLLQTELLRWFLSGRLNLVAAAEADFLSLGEEHGVPALALSFARRLPVQAMLYTGRSEDALSLLQGESGQTQFRRMYALAYAGLVIEARQLLDQHLVRHAERIAEGEVTAPVLVSLLESAILTGHKLAAARFAELLQPAQGAALVGVLGFYPPVCVSRMLGDAAALLGVPAEAHEYYLRALALVEAIGCLPEGAITRLHLAHLLAEHPGGNPAAARVHVERAIPDLRAAGMQPALRRALALRERLAD